VISSLLSVLVLFVASVVIFQRGRTEPLLSAALLGVGVGLLGGGMLSLLRRGWGACAATLVSVLSLAWLTSEWIDAPHKSGLSSGWTRVSCAALALPEVGILVLAAIALTTTVAIRRRTRKLAHDAHRTER
jgi:hypothetical protein